MAVHAAKVSSLFQLAQHLLSCMTYCNHVQRQLCICLQVADAAHHMLSVIDIGAAQLNDKINLFKDDVKFPEVFRSGLSVLLVLSICAGHDERS